MSPRMLGGKAISPARTSMMKSPNPVLDGKSTRGAKAKSPSASYSNLKSITKSP